MLSCRDVIDRRLMLWQLRACQQSSPKSNLHKGHRVEANGGDDKGGRPRRRRTATRTWVSSIADAAEAESQALTAGCPFTREQQRRRARSTGEQSEDEKNEASARSSICLVKERCKQRINENYGKMYKGRFRERVSRHMMAHSSTISPLPLCQREDIAPRSSGRDMRMGEGARKPVPSATRARKSTAPCCRRPKESTTNGEKRPLRSRTQASYLAAFALAR